MRAIDLDYQGFASWAAAEPRRDVIVKILGEEAEAVAGQWIENEYVCQISLASVGEIDLVSKLKRKQEERLAIRQAEYERLKTEFGQKKQGERAVEETRNANSNL